MKKNLWLGLLIGAVAIVAILGLRAVYAHYAHKEPALCNVCRRPIMPETAFSVLADGHTMWYCCPRCWVTSLRVSDGKYADATATDYVSAKRSPADQCVYVEGSELMPCCGPGSTPGRDGMPAMACYDRCFPSTIAFASPNEALQFSRTHGGKIISFQTLTDEAKKP